MTYYNEIIYILRILIAGLCGGIIGYERKNHLKEAGARTHSLVACGAALMMILSKYGFFDLTADVIGVRGADPARIAAQVVSGIGFLGAGMIFVHKNTVTGLTTAAGIWTTAGIGMAMGAGLYITGGAVTVIVVIVQIFRHLNLKQAKALSTRIVNIYDVSEENYQDEIVGALTDKGAEVLEVSISRKGKEGNKNYRIYIELPDSMNEEDVLSLIKYDAEVITEQ